jgi:hypothetical protein
MGAHTLGRASKEASGHDGFWIPGCQGQSSFDNEYYKRLTTSQIPWIKKVIILNQLFSHFLCYYYLLEYWWKSW